MALLSQIIYNFSNLRKGGIQSQSSNLSDRQIEFIVGYYRALLIKRDKDAGKYLTGNLVQNLGKVEVQKADKNECCEIDGDCIVRTKLPVPRAIDTNTQNLITYVGLLDGSESFQRTTYQKAVYDQYAKYTGDLPKWYMNGDYIYIVNPPGKILKYINIQGIFEDPSAANEFKTCDCAENGLDCYKGQEYEYPLSTAMLDSIYKMMMASEAKFAMILPQDTTNDSKDD